MIRRTDIDAAVEGYIASLLATSYYGEDGIQISDDFGPGDIPKAALISIRRDVEAFLKRNERLLREATYRVWPTRTTEEPLLRTIGFGGVGGDFSVVRNGDAQTFDDMGWRPEEISEKLDAAAWAFPKTELYVGDEDSPEPGRLYFWTEPKRR
jgi:hypothetical protein